MDTSQARKRMTALGAAILVILGVPIAWSRWAHQHESNEESAGTLSASAQKERLLTYLLGESLAELGRHDEFVRVVELSDVACPESCAPRIRGERAEALGRLGHWSEAASDYRIALGSSWFQDAIILVMEDRQIEYRALCGQCLARMDEPGFNGMAAVQLALLAPDAVRDWSKLLKYAERRSAENQRETARIDQQTKRLQAEEARLAGSAHAQGGFGADKTRFQIEDALRGRLLCRAKRYPESIAQLQRCEQVHSDPLNWAFLALAEHGRGDRSRSVACRGVGAASAQASGYDIWGGHFALGARPAAFAAPRSGPQPGNNVAGDSSESTFPHAKNAVRENAARYAPAAATHPLKAAFYTSMPVECGETPDIEPDRPQGQAAPPLIGNSMQSPEGFLQARSNRSSFFRSPAFPS